MSSIVHHNEIHAEDESWAVAEALGLNAHECEAWSMLTDLIEKFLTIEQAPNLSHLPAPLQVHLSALQNHLLSRPSERRGDELFASRTVKPTKRSVR